METVIKKAIDPNTGKEYEIELPAPERVERAILALDFPPDGIRTIVATDMLAEKFGLSEEEKYAKNKSRDRNLDVFRYDIVAPAIKRLLNNGKLKQEKSRKPYFLVQEEEQEDIEEKGKQKEQEEVVPTVEDIEDIYQKVHKELAEELLEHIKSKKPAFFEKLVIDLLVQMGYGGSREDAEAVGRSGDGGIDGIINEDRLGLDVVYVQAKQWEGSVSRPEIQKFAGALQGQRARKGIFVTTSEFTKGCLEYVKSIDSKIILIDGQQLAQFMIEHDVGVSTTKTYEIKRVDSDYFAETE